MGVTHGRRVRGGDRRKRLERPDVGSLAPGPRASGTTFAGLTRRLNV